MAYPVYQVPAGDVLPILFSTYDGGTGASLTMTGLAVTDIEIYKDGGTTQRASDAGYTLLDTDGIDFDGTTGIHGFSIDTGDNTDASFYTVGAWFHVVVSAITVDAQTVNFIAAAFRIMAAETSAGVPKADVSHWLGTAAATPTVAGVPEVDVTHWIGTAAATPTVAGVPEVDATHWNGTAVTTPPSVNATQISGDSTAADTLESWLDGTAGAYPELGIIDQGTAQSATATTLVLRAATPFGSDDACLGATLMAFGSTQGYWQSRLITDYTTADDTCTVDTWDVTPSGTITYKVFGSAPSSSSSPPTAAQIADAVWDEDTTGHTTSGTFGEQLKTDVDAILVDTGTTLDGRIPAALVSGRMDASVGAMAANVMTAAAAAADLTTELQSGLATAAALATVDTVVDAIQAKTDSLTFTQAGHVDANVQRINDVAITGDGSAGDKFDVV
jgi:hypothetical protein